MLVTEEEAREKELGTWLGILKSIADVLHDAGPAIYLTLAFFALVALGILE